MLDLEHLEIDAKCPSCGYYIYFTLKDVRLNKPIVCGGCKCLVRLVDHMSSFEKGSRQIIRALRRLDGAIAKIGG